MKKDKKNDKIVVVNGMKRRVRKVTKRRLTVFGTLSLIAIIYFSVTLVFHLYSIYDLNKEKKELEVKYDKLVKEADDLQIEINKLNDPDYLARYAREKYSYSKEGEYIIKIKDVNDDISDVDEDINMNYLIVGLSGVIFLIFIYIIVKGRSKKDT